MFYNVNLNWDEPHRLKFSSEIYETRNHSKRSITVMLDTGCYNSLIPINRAKAFGVSINMKRHIVIGANVIETEAYIIDTLRISDMEIKSVFMLAAAFKGELADTILMGLNVLNNWKYTIHRKDNIIKIEESLPVNIIPNIINPYRNYFDEKGRYVLMQNDS